MAEIRFGFKAIRPFDAWHDDQVVHYEPGDEVPAGEWKGAAVDAMVENGKLMRYATNVYAPGELGGDALVEEAVAEVLAEETGGDGRTPVPETLTDPFPRATGGGYFTLSDGRKVRGKAKALAAQAELDIASEAA